MTDQEIFPLLIVEDDQADRIALRRLLRQLPVPCEVVEASSVSEARSLIREKRWRWILSDYLLPDGEGREVLSAALEHHPYCAVIFLTGKGDESLAAELMREGARDYIPKGSLSAHRLASSLRAAARLAEAEMRADLASQGYQFLADAGARLVGAVELDEVTEAATRACLGDFADLCILDLEVTPGSYARSGFAHIDEEVETRHRAAVLASIFTADHVVSLTERGRGLVFDFDEGALRSVAGEGAGAEALRAMSPDRGKTLPLRARGRILGFLTFARCGRGDFLELDIPVLHRFTDLVALAIDNARLFERLDRALGERERVLAVVAHDLRTPLGAIAGAAGNLQTLDLDETGRRKQVELVSRAAERMNRLVEDLLDVARLEEGALSVETVPHAPDQLVEESAALHERALAAADVSIDLVVEDGLPHVRVDPTRGVQILGNLVSNAIRHAPAGSTVRVRAERKGEFVRISVEDEGPGIPAEQIPRLFDRFWQAQPNGNKGGAGLGLAIARGLVDVHGGTLGVESDPGVLTRFWFTLPVAGD